MDKKTIKLWNCQQCGKTEGKEIESKEEIGEATLSYSDKDIDIYLEVNGWCIECD